jgi:hypothetical protein
LTIDKPQISFRAVLSTSQASIIKMTSAVVNHVQTTIAAVNESIFSSSTKEVIQIDWTSTSSIECIVERSGTSSSKAKLSAGHISIICRPEAITNGSPGLIEAEFNTSFKLVSSIHQTNISILTETFSSASHIHIHCMCAASDVGIISTI